MAEQRENITIRFELVDTFNNRFMQESDFPVFYDLGDTELGCIGEKFNTFLEQVGYVRTNDYIFMEDVNEEELEALQHYLEEYRDIARQEDGCL